MEDGRDVESVVADSGRLRAFCNGGESRLMADEAIESSEATDSRSGRLTEGKTRAWAIKVRLGGGMLASKLPSDPA